MNTVGGLPNDVRTHFRESEDKENILIFQYFQLGKTT